MNPAKHDPVSAPEPEPGLVFFGRGRGLVHGLGTITTTERS